MAEYGCEVILDSEIQGERITCFRVTYPRIVHSEFLRHRMASFCSSSSRAIPLERLIEQYVGFYPDNWRKHQSGMQPIEGDNLFKKDDITFFNASWGNSKSIAIETARDLHKEGVAKEQVNRLLEPYSFITHLVQMPESGYKNFFQLRTDSNAQYEIRVIANMMKEMYRASYPLKRKYHFPFYQVDFVADKNPDILKYLKVSSARCARTSYYNHDGNTPTIEEDLKLSETLLNDRHLSPFEFPVIDRFEAENIFPDLKWFEFVEEAKWWKKIELKEGLPITIRKDLSGNLANWKVVQYRKILEMSDI